MAARTLSATTSCRRCDEGATEKEGKAAASHAWRVRDGLLMVQEREERRWVEVHGRGVVR
jgi:hypothetical protein